MSPENMAVGTICPDELRGYTIDQRARWMFLLRYAPYSLTAIVLGWLVIQYATTDSAPIWVSFCGLLAAFALHGFGMVRYFRARLKTSSFFEITPVCEA
jgi:hypothetical protein